MVVGEVILSHPWNYQIMKRADPFASNFSVISGKDSRVVYETTNHTDAFECFDYCQTEMADLGKMTYIKGEGIANPFPLSESVILDGAEHQFWLGNSGPRGVACTIQPSGNFPAFTLTNSALFNKIQDINLQHNQSGYTSSMIRLLNRDIGNQFHGIRFDDLGTDKGNCFGFEIASDAPASVTNYKNSIFNCESNGFDNFKLISNLKVSTASDWFISTNHVVDSIVWNTKRCIQAVGATPSGGSGSMILLEKWNNVDYQHSNGNTVAAGEGVFDLSGLSWNWNWIFTDVFVWDITAPGINFANVNTATELELKGCNPTHLIGGAGASLNPSKIKRWDYYTQNTGRTVITGSPTQRDYVISHGLSSLGVIPKVRVTQISSEPNSMLPFVVPESLITSSQFQIRFLRPPPRGASIPFLWWAGVA
jgi:hypothetical protein